MTLPHPLSHTHTPRNYELPVPSLQPPFSRGHMIRLWSSCGPHSTTLKLWKANTLGRLDAWWGGLIIIILPGSVYVCVCLCVYICVYMCVCVHVHVYVCACTCVHEQAGGGC